MELLGVLTLFIFSLILFMCWIRKILSFGPEKRLHEPSLAQEVALFGPNSRTWETPTVDANSCKPMQRLSTVRKFPLRRSAISQQRPPCSFLLSFSLKICLDRRERLMAALALLGKPEKRDRLKLFDAGKMGQKVFWYPLGVRLPALRKFF